MPIDEGCELFDADVSLEEDEGINSDNNLSDSGATETADMNVNDDVSAVGSNSNGEVSRKLPPMNYRVHYHATLTFLMESIRFVKKRQRNWHKPTNSILDSNRRYYF